jgi:hypothetical protein
VGKNTCANKAYNGSWKERTSKFIDTCKKMTVKYSETSIHIDRKFMFCTEKKQTNTANINFF